MNYPDAETLNQSFGTTHWLVKKFTKGLSNADSLVQPPFQGNCLNWVLGHILSGRNEALTYLGGDPFWGDEELARYKTGSPPITGPEDAIPLEQLLETLEVSQERIAAALEQMTPEALAAIVETRFGERPVGQHVGGLHWHETYHAGQLELLRELAA